MRTTEFLTHPVFHQHRSETEMLRYLRRLADTDLALDRSMIPLGLVHHEAQRHHRDDPGHLARVRRPPPLRARSTRPRATGELITELEAWLAEITGYDAVSLQPNAGSQGELAGLLAIRAYHRQPGRRRTGTSASSRRRPTAPTPPSAVMAGMRVVVVACDDDGNVDLADLRGQGRRARAMPLAALMVTYPSTHGVFEEHISEICDVVHDAGGQVYLDGANLNALVGVARPGRVRGRRVAT